MKLPFTIYKNVSSEQKYIWDNLFVKEKRDFFEGLWRRNQRPENAHFSGWKSANDARRRIIYVKDSYKIVGNSKFDFVLWAPYLWIHLLFPSNEIKKFKDQFLLGIKNGKWTKISDSSWSHGDLVVNLKEMNTHPEDVIAKRVIPDNYSILEFELCSKNTDMKTCRYSALNVWGILKRGIRTIPKQGKPKIFKYINKKIFDSIFPAQFELGSGPSLEAGIPPLHTLHKIYGLIKGENKKFLLDPKKDNFIYNLLSNPEGFFKKSTLMYKKILQAKSTSFYKLLKNLFDKKMLVGPVITNNFDFLSRRAGLKEFYVRRYDETKIIPKMKFPSTAKSLVVVGVHADRRLIEESARKNGLKVVFVDPGEFRISGNKNIRYPIEAPKDEDIVLNMTAKEFTKQLRDLVE